MILEENRIVPCYTDYKNEKGFQGYCILIEKISEDDTFYVDNEELIFKSSDEDDMSSSLTKVPSSVRKKIKLVEYIEFLLENRSRSVRQFKSQMKKLTDRSPSSYYDMYNLVQTYKTKYMDSKLSIKNILAIDTEILVRYFQQKYLKGWRPSLYRSEKWLVEFYPQTHEGKVLFNSPFRTSRRIRTLVKISPKDEGKGKDSLSRLTTYNNVSSLSLNSF